MSTQPGPEATPVGSLWQPKYRGDTGKEVIANDGEFVVTMGFVKSRNRRALFLKRYTRTEATR